MSPGPGHDDGRPAKSAHSSNVAATTQQGKNTPRLGRLAAPTLPIVVAVVTDVVGGREGTTRSLLVWRCYLCGGGVRHLSQARGELPPVLRRRGPHGPVLLAVATSAAVAA